MKKELLTYKNLLFKILNLELVNFNKENFEITYNNKHVADFEVNDKIKSKNNIELIIYDKDFLVLINSKFDFENPFLVWDWTSENDSDNEKSNIETKIFCNKN